MAQLTMLSTCQVCGAEESLDGLLGRMIDDAQVRQLIATVISISLPLGRDVVRYLRLHKPLKQKLRLEKLRGLLAELVPDLERNAIERNGRTWLVGPDAWRAAFDAIFEHADKGGLTLPLEGNGYLYSILVRLVERHEASQERDSEAQRRQRVRPGTVTVTGMSGPVGAALDRVFGGRDPVLDKLDQDRAKAAPMPAGMRQKVAEILAAGTVNGTVKKKDGV